jgi:hypothetical protein
MGYIDSLSIGYHTKFSTHLNWTMALSLVDRHGSTPRGTKFSTRFSTRILVRKLLPFIASLFLLLPTPQPPRSKRKYWQNFLNPTTNAKSVFLCWSPVLLERGWGARSCSRESAALHVKKNSYVGFRLSYNHRTCAHGAPGGFAAK